MGEHQSKRQLAARSLIWAVACPLEDHAKANGSGSECATNQTSFNF